ncbi:hypothetical protein LINPERPRIM_LOCUS21610 [Linum perenne]
MDDPLPLPGDPPMGPFIQNIE